MWKELGEKHNTERKTSQKKRQSNGENLQGRNRSQTPQEKQAKRKESHKQGANNKRKRN